MIRYLNERQSPELAKGEVDLRKEILSLSEKTLTIKSHEPVSTSSNEITLQKQRDLGVLYNVVSGEQSSNSVDDSKDGISTSDTSAEEAVGPSSEYKLPKSLQTRLESNWADPMDDIAYIRACSLAKLHAPKFTTPEAKLLHQQHTIQFRSLAQLIDYTDQSVEKLHTDIKYTSATLAISG